jgi:CHAT domain-containing protein
LAAGNDSTDDGMLMGYEIADLNLHCELMTLSACETGRGEVVQGEGVLGLPRLFLGAGAKSVLMTLWKVDDKFTSELMPAFYDNLLKRKLSKADALSAAKRTMLDRPDLEGQGYYQHPFYWASFALFGDAGGIKSSTRSVPGYQLALGLLILGLFGVLTYRYLRRHGPA